MASITNRPLGAGFSAAGIMTTLNARLVEWNDVRVTRKSLSKLSNRQLDDLGLNRGDIDEIVAGHMPR